VRNKKYDTNNENLLRKTAKFFASPFPNFLSNTFHALFSHKLRLTSLSFEAFHRVTDEDSDILEYYVMSIGN